MADEHTVTMDSATLARIMTKITNKFGHCQRRGITHHAHLPVEDRQWYCLLETRPDQLKPTDHP